jgi:hypothetical protein
MEECSGWKNLHQSKWVFFFLAISELFFGLLFGCFYFFIFFLGKWTAMRTFRVQPRILVYTREEIVSSLTGCDGIRSIWRLSTEILLGEEDPNFSYSSTASWVRNYRQHIQQRNTTRSNSWHPRFHFFSFSHSHTLIIIRFFIHPQELFVYVCMSSSSILLRLLFDFLSSFSRFQLPFFISRWHNGGRQFLLLLFPRTKEKKNSENEKKSRCNNRKKSFCIIFIWAHVFPIGYAPMIPDVPKIDKLKHASCGNWFTCSSNRLQYKPKECCLD